MMKRLRTTVLPALVTVAALASTPSASSQCYVPDGLDMGSCCQQTQANLPPFGAGGLGGLGICWTNCSPTVQNNLKVSWGSLSYLGCATFSAGITVADAGSGASIMTGKMRMDYTRTWIETDPSGIDHQVWRFLVKVDLISILPTGVPPICPLPKCLPPTSGNNSAFFYGYMDFSLMCGSSSLAFENSLVLFHGCDFLIHKPFFSSRPGVYHPTESYAIVAPHNAVQAFVPANLPSPSGALAFEGLRKVTYLGGMPECRVEDPLQSGSITSLAQGCFCPLSAFPTQNSINFVTGTGSCTATPGVNSNFQSLNIAFPTLPWPYMISTSIGRWTTPGIFPGAEAAWVNEGLFRTFDVCSNVDYFEVKYGATTLAGWQAFVLPGGPPVNTFLDLADNWSAPVAGPHPLPLMGDVQPTNHLIYSNIP